jgi:hypothetical protein
MAMIPDRAATAAKIKMRHESKWGCQRIEKVEKSKGTGRQHVFA